MHNANNNRTAFFALTVLGVILAWRNRFEIQRRLESLGVRTPLLEGSIKDVARSVASKVGGKTEHGATLAENLMNRKAG